MQAIPEVIGQIEFFKDFSTEEVEGVIEAGSWVKAEPGERIITEGDDDLYLYILLKGQVNVVKNRSVLAVLQAGDSFGEIGALARSPRTAHVVAKEQVFCLRFEPAQIDRMETGLQLKFVKKILYTMADRLIRLNRRMVTQ
ncbi:MAG: cyclic nucleotide-binding domain-containing protein [Deltaproteobacteria bacterium]|nr:cyclic nucleotide-binding domain-containing protein [Deltaproteobacteria bacterium]